MSNKNNGVRMMPNESLQERNVKNEQTTKEYYENNNIDVSKALKNLLNERKDQGAKMTRKKL